MNKISLICITVVVMALSLTAVSYGASTLQIAPAGDGIFVIQGIGIEQAAAFDIVLVYDTSSISNPRVTMGPLVDGAMNAVNTNVPGTIRMAIIRTSPVTGTGPLATIAFDRKGEGQGRITLFRASLANINGKPVPSVVLIQNPSGPSTASDTGNQQTTPNPENAQGKTATTVPVTGGTLQVIPGIVAVKPETTVPADTKETIRLKDQNTVPARDENRSNNDSTTASRTTDRPASAPGDGKKMYTQESILDKFRTFKGERTFRTLSVLFDQESLIGFRQEPRIVLTDGRKKAIITFITMTSSNKAPDVALMSAQLLSLKRDLDNSNTWVAEVLPDKGAVSASLAVSQDNLNMVFPLTVAPVAPIDMDRSGTIDERDLSLFFKERGTLEKPLHDLNNDGVRNYIDEYIFIANVLVLRGQSRSGNTLR